MTSRFYTSTHIRTHPRTKFWHRSPEMCGRFVQYTLLPIIKEEFNLKTSEAKLHPSYNIAPTQYIPTIINEDGNQLVMCRWGLIPSWSKDLSIGNRMINARAETVAEKPSFRGPFKTNRCLIIADGFYEWRKTPDGKVPVYIRMKNERPFGMAGLFSDWDSPDGEMLRTCTIITTQPNDLLAPIHNRMPVIIGQGHRNLWLDPDINDPVTLTALLGSYPSGEMEMWEVSKVVNSPANVGPGNIIPV